MKKYSYLIIIVLISSLVLTGCLLSNVGQVPTSDQGGVTYLTRHTEGKPLGIDLIAGQTDDIGDVLVWNDAENLYVKFVYEGPECGFLEVHLQVDEGEFSNDILTKKGNPIPGKFENSYDVGCFTENTFTYNLADEGFDCDDGLVIAAHAVVPSGGANISNLNGPVYASNVFSVSPGDNAVRSPLTTLGAPDSAYEVLNFYSLGIGGCIELEFADFVGGTLTVYETTWHHFDGDKYPKESANIYVSADGSDWTYLGEANNDGQSWSNTPIPNVFTLEECIKYVRICDTTDPALHTGPYNAFDLDAVEAQYFCEKETAWGYGTRFVDKGNWATYFTYTVQQLPEFGMVLWLDAGKGITSPVNGNPVSIWEDQSVNGNDAAQATASFQPTYVESVSDLNNKPVVRFTGGEKYLRHSPILTYDYTAFYVLKLTESGVKAVYYYHAGAVYSGHLGFFAECKSISDGWGSVSHHPADNHFRTSDEYPTEEGWRIHTHQPNALYKNGDVVNYLEVDDVYADLGGITDVGSRFDNPSLYFVGDIAEILVYDRILTDSERMMVETYLNAKYEIYP